ncbi:6622_t:CDS:1, partial [Acaulospora morrowiae]
MGEQVHNTNFVFINSSDPLMPSQVINDTKPFIRLPFPPIIDPHDLITFSKGSCTPSRAPNAFIIYRKLFIKTAKSEGYTLPMTVISSMASKSWEQEPEIVKVEYKRIAKEAFEYRNEIYPKVKRGGKRKTWNVISFDHKSDTSVRKNELCKSINNRSVEIQQKTDTPISFPDFECPILNLDVLPDLTDYIYPSPDLTVSSGFSSPDINNFNSPTMSLENSENYCIDSPIQSEIFSSSDMSDEFIINSPTISLGNYQTDSSDMNLRINDSSLIGFLENQFGLGIFEPENVNETIEEHNDSSLLNGISNDVAQS